MAAIDPLPEPLQLPRVAIENPSLEIQAAESSQSGPTVAVPDDVELVTVQKPTSTQTNSTYKKIEKKIHKRRRKAETLRLETEKAKAQGLPSPKKVRHAYRCKKCGQPQNKETGHSQYYGQTYCPNEEGQIPKSEWRKQKAEEREAKKSANL